MWFPSSSQYQNQCQIQESWFYRDKIGVYDEHPMAGRDIQYRAPGSWSEHTSPLNNKVPTENDMLYLIHTS